MKQVSRYKASSGDGLRLDLFLPYRLSALAGRTSRLLSGVYESRFGISIPEWRVVAHVAAHDALSLREVSRLTHLDKATASRAVARLEDHGFLANSRNRYKAENYQADAGVPAVYRSQQRGIRPGI